jgi:uncharacterized protein (TIGR02271 family)
MSAPSIETVQSWQGRTMVDPAGDKLGTIDAIYLDDEAGQPEWATVPVQREELRVEREPITDANLEAATSGPEISEAEHEVTLREETPVVEKTRVPRERVRLGTETVTDERQVAEEVRKEQIQVDGDQDQR